MRPDHLAYKRATAISLWGLALQLASAGAILIYAIFARDHAALTVAATVATASLVWIGLALVFHQHTLERLEAIETEALESEAGASSVFDQNTDDLRVAARRLAWMHRILLPLLSILIALVYLAIAVVRFLSAERFVNPDAFVAPPLTGWAIAVGLGIAVLAFVFARFVAGMAKQPAWANLRAGAAAAAGSTVLGLALAVSHFVAFLGSDGLLRYFTLAAPIIAGVLGVEVFANFILNVYRPRRAGEAPKPAFESRILAFLAAPDRLAQSFGEAVSYQFGFDVTTSWFYRLLSRTVLMLTLLAALLLWGLSSFAVVQPNERALITRFGALRAEVGSGLHFKWPWPIERVDAFPASTINVIDLATPHPTREGAILWTAPHVKEGQEVYALVQSAESSAGAGLDLALVSIEVPLQYTVSDLGKYERFAAPDQRQPLLKAVASRQLIEDLGTRTVADVLGLKRDEINRSLHQRIQRAFDAINSGVTVLSVGVAGAHPPQDESVAKSYEDVINAHQQREAALDRARAESTRILTRAAGDLALSERIVSEINALERLQSQNAQDQAIREQELAIENLVDQAGGEAKSILVQARADRWEKHMSQRGLAARHAGRSAAYHAAPAVYKASLYFDALADLASNARVYISAFGDSHIRLNLEDVQDASAIPDPIKPKEQ
ncbi:MAG: SPFH domain-containing protein [Phycisphaerales bacterium]